MFDKTFNAPSKMDSATFSQTFGGVYEHSPWIADRLALQGLSEAHDTALGLHEGMREIVNHADSQALLGLLRAHPDLAGRLAVRGELTPESTAEQAGSGLDQCTEEEFSEFSDLNDRYKKRFGFPFILAVRGRARPEILRLFRQRIENDRDTEFREALEQVHRIALMRIQSIFEA